MTGNEIGLALSENWWDILLWVINFAFWGFMLYMRTVFVSKETYSDDMKKIEDEHDELEKRVATIENDMKHLPDGETARQLLLEMSELRGELKVVYERSASFDNTVDRLQKQVDRMDTFLRQRAK